MSTLGPVDVPALAMDGIGLLGTLGFFVPASLVVLFVVGAVWWDRRMPDPESSPDDVTGSGLPD